MRNSALSKGQVRGSILPCKVPNRHAQLWRPRPSPYDLVPIGLTRMVSRRLPRADAPPGDPCRRIRCHSQGTDGPRAQARRRDCARIAGSFRSDSMDFRIDPFDRECPQGESHFRDGVVEEFPEDLFEFRSDRGGRAKGEAHLRPAFRIAREADRQRTGPTRSRSFMPRPYASPAGAPVRRRPTTRA